MERQTSLHPADETLVSYGLGNLDDTVAESVNKHLRQCVPCRHRVAELSADSFVGRLREAQRPAGDARARPKTIVEPDPARQSPAAGKQPSTPIPPISSGNLPPELVNHPQYEVIREIGRGGMGVVYLARNKLMDRLEVLKVLSKEMLAKQGTADRFLREIQSAAKLHHANVVAAYTAIQVGDLLVFAMEYVEGNDLAELLRARGPLPVVNACYFAYQAAQGLQHAHERGMIHRDIKPGNLILLREGKKAVIKILDFGLAKVTSERGLDRALTQQGEMLGTPDYIAPEQTLDAQKADIRADIYSLGCTLYHLLTGSTPFSGNSLFEVLQAHHSVEAKPLNLVRPEVPVELAAVVAKMMAKDPNRRYQTPAEVVQALKPFLKPGGLTSPQPELSQVASQVDRPAAVAGSAPGKDDSSPSLIPMEAVQPAERWKSLIDTPQLDRSTVGKSAIRKGARRQPPWMWPSVAVGAVLFGLVTAWASGVFSVKTKDGVIVLENLPPDAQVTVDGGMVRLQTTDEKTFAISIASGKKQRLQVKKEGFTTFGEEVEIDAGGRRSITVRLEPIAVATAKAAGARAPVKASAAAVPIVKNADYDAIATGKWIPVLEREIDLRGGRLVIPEQRAGDVIIRARVKKVSGQNVALALRQSPKRGYSAWFNGGNWFGIWKWGADPSLRDWHAPTNFDGYFEFAFSAVGEMLTVYADGKRIGEVRDPDFQLGSLSIGARGGQSLFQDVEIMILDKSAPSTDDEGFVPLFNGKDLTGWKTHPSQPGNWRVEDGVLIGSGPDRSHLYSERDDFKDFHLRMVVRINDGGKTGIYFRAPFGPNMAQNVKMPISPSNKATWLTGYNAKIDAARFGGLLIGANPELHRTRETVLNPEEWITFEVIAEGNHLIIKVNGQTTSDYTDERGHYTSGHIALQQHTPTTVVEFRKIEIKELSQSAPHESTTSTPSPQPEAAKGEGPVADSQDGFEPLFNGHDLTGWNVYPEGTGDWKVEDGLLMSSGPASHLLSKRGDYQNFRFRVEAQINDHGNSGQYFRTQFGPRFPKGYEAQINSTHRDPIKTGSLYGFKETEVREVLVPPGEWFTQEVTAIGNHIVIKVNGKTTVDYWVTDPNKTYSEGHFALQQHDPGTVVKFRKIEVLELPATTSEVRSEVAKPVDQGFVRLFNGQNLNGWTDEGGGATWTPEDGQIVARAQGANALSHLLTVRDYSNFILRFEFLVESESWGAIDLRAIPGETLGTVSIRHPWLRLGAPGQAQTGTNRWMRGETAIKPDQQPEIRPAGLWNQMEIEVNGHSLRSSLNGKEIVRATLNEDVLLTNGAIPGLNRIKGRVGLSHGKGTIRYRAIEIKELPASAVVASRSEQGYAPMDIALRIKQAKTEFHAAMGRANGILLSQFDPQIRLQRSRMKSQGALTLVESLQHEKDLWTAKGLVPWSGPMRPALRKYVNSVHKAHNDLERAFDVAIQQAMKAHDPQAAQLRTEKTIAVGPHVVANWQCTGGGNNWSFTLYSNLRIGNPKSPDVWSFEGDALVLRLVNSASSSGTFVDRCKLAPSGKIFHAENQFGGRYTATLVDE